MKTASGRLEYAGSWVVWRISEPVWRVKWPATDPKPRTAIILAMLVAEGKAHWPSLGPSPDCLVRPPPGSATSPLRLASSRNALAYRSDQRAERPCGLSLSSRQSSAHRREVDGGALAAMKNCPEKPGKGSPRTNTGWADRLALRCGGSRPCRRLGRRLLSGLDLSDLIADFVIARARCVDTQ